ncbi:hypothetical protein PP707_01135 [Acetobacter pasteurianus]|nr:hypothetical protein [Acetobacter pasteurianus]
MSESVEPQDTAYGQQSPVVPGGSGLQLQNEANQENNGGDAAPGVEAGAGDGAGAGEAVKQEDERPKHINLKVTDGSSEIFFKIKDNTPMKKLIDAFCKRQGKSSDTLRFFINGVRVKETDTPQSLDLDDGDVIEAHRAQTGGASF